jgi:hypothetical protein
MNMKRIHYSEGQWFAIPLKKGGYAIGIITRGEYKTKGGLGYFFGPKYNDIPSGEETFLKNSNNAIFIGIFGDLGIIRGEWPLIENGKPFIRKDWPVPLFHRISPLQPEVAYVVEYAQESFVMYRPIRERVVQVTKEVTSMPKDSVYGYGAVEIKLTRLLDPD